MKAFWLIVLMLSANGLESSQSSATVNKSNGKIISTHISNSKSWTTTNSASLSTSLPSTSSKKNSKNATISTTANTSNDSTTRNWTGMLGAISSSLTSSLNATTMNSSVLDGNGTVNTSMMSAKYVVMSSTIMFNSESKRSDWSSGKVKSGNGPTAKLSGYSFSVTVTTTLRVTPNTTSVANNAISSVTAKTATIVVGSTTSNVTAEAISIVTGTTTSIAAVDTTSIPTTLTSSVKTHASSKITAEATSIVAGNTASIVAVDTTSIPTTPLFSGKTHSSSIVTAHTTSSVAADKTSGKLVETTAQPVQATSMVATNASPHAVSTVTGKTDTNSMSASIPAKSSILSLRGSTTTFHPRSTSQDTSIVSSSDVSQSKMMSSSSVMEQSSSDMTNSKTETGATPKKSSNQGNVFTTAKTATSSATIPATTTNIIQGKASSTLLMPWSTNALPKNTSVISSSFALPSAIIPKSSEMMTSDVTRLPELSHVNTLYTITSSLKSDTKLITALIDVTLSASPSKPSNTVISMISLSSNTMSFVMTTLSSGMTSPMMATLSSNMMSSVVTSSWSSMASPLMTSLSSDMASPVMTSFSSNMTSSVMTSMSRNISATSSGNVTVSSFERQKSSHTSQTTSTTSTQFQTSSFVPATSAPGSCTCSKLTYPSNCRKMCCTGGRINATPACMVSGMSVAYTHEWCNKTVESKRCGDVKQCACKGSQLPSLSFAFVLMLSLVVWSL